MTPPWRRPFAAYCGFAAVLLLLPWTVQGCAEDPEQPPSLVVVLVDTLRADHVSGYGGTEGLTPNLAALAREGVLFRRAHAASPWTGPSVAAILTGRYPDEVGVRHLTDPLPDSATVLAERLRDGGYHTCAVVSNGVVGPAYGYDQGYDTFIFERNRVNRNPDGTVGEPPVLFAADRVTEEALAWVRTARAPFFLYLHYNDPHDPYLPPGPFRERFLGDRKPLAESLLLDGRFSRAGLGPAEAERLKAYYEGEVAFTDQEVGRLLDGLPDHTLVVVTGDHGEEFLDHGRFRHGHSLYQELIHVPLIIRGPGVERGAVVEAPVSHVDLAPTLLEAAGMTWGSPSSGTSLLSVLRGGAEPRGDRLLFSVLESRKQRRLAVGRGDLKLIYQPRRERFMIFDLDRDPRERRDLAKAFPEGAMSLLRAARERALRLPMVPEQHRDPGFEAREEELRALGYGR